MTTMRWWVGEGRSDAKDTRCIRHNMAVNTTHACTNTPLRTEHTLARKRASTSNRDPEAGARECDGTSARLSLNGTHGGDAHDEPPELAREQGEVRDRRDPLHRHNVFGHVIATDESYTT